MPAQQLSHSLNRTEEENKMGKLMGKDREIIYKLLSEAKQN